MRKKRRGGGDKKEDKERYTWSWIGLHFPVLPTAQQSSSNATPNVKNHPQRPKHTAQRQSPGKCLHSLRAETFHGQASASQENTPQCSAAISNLWFSSSQNLSPLASPSAQPGFAATFSLLSQCQPPKHFSLFLSCLLCPHFILFPDLPTARQESSYHYDYTQEQGCLKECKSSMIFKGCLFRVWGGLIWKDRRSMAQASSWATR